MRSRSFELDRIELGYPAAVCIDVENVHTIWGGLPYVVQLARHATDPTFPEPPCDPDRYDRHINPWGPA